MTAAESSSRATAPATRVLTHCRQRQYWDCGLACASSVLQYFGSSADTSLPALAAAAGIENNSVWTIDLALLLADAGVPLVFHTIMPGVDLQHRSLAFYQQIDADKQRVEDRFRRAHESGVATRQHSLSMDYICEQLAAGRAMFICLVDLRKLICKDCGKLDPRHLLQFTFAGHYVVLLGYSFERDEIEYMDPGAGKDRCFIDASQLDQARRVVGTDEDIIEIGVTPAIVG